MSTPTPASDDPRVIQAQLEDTRRELGSNVDALVDKVTPSKIMHRQGNKVKRAFGTLSDTLMGSASDAQDAVGDAADHVSGAAHHAAAQAKGNPLAVGLIAFGAGLLAASLIPASTAEKKIAANVKDAAEPLAHELADAATEVGEHLKQPLADAAEAVKETATDAATTVQHEAASSASDVKEQATGPGQDTGV
ncbi:DUF3618 domain-containing protein [Microterricola pindariensis]|uniref:DUF3618 domain-containing protein n=1 Tax=Microterricola pindariensis TaxID=478010 RepID=A0ABX5AZD6_9MICO|nr:DUF3618 domain-containing protein [Microterricola pindariensis]PPL20293.1 hypothetical protein GY24_01745 [Microterricola pindariensis]